MSVAYDLYPLFAPTDEPEDLAPAEFVPAGADGPRGPRLYDANRACGTAAVAPRGAVRAPARQGMRPVGDRVAPMAVLHAPAASALTAPLRLTRRGVVVLALAVAAVGVALVWAAALSAPSVRSAPTSGAATVTVHAGDTLWGIASQVAPSTDPRVEVAQLSRLNHLTDAAVMPGQTLRLR